MNAAHHSIGGERWVGGENVGGFQARHGKLAGYEALYQPAAGDPQCVECRGFD